jgi:REP element-mobilizing transposase RayT
MGHSYTNLLYHVVFATKGREPWLDDTLRPELYTRLGDILKKESGTPLIINGMPEHVHILAKLRPDHRVSEIVSDLKSRSSGWIHRTRERSQHFAWQVGYGAFTVSQSQVEVVRRYIEQQEEHHRRTPFDVEYRQFLRRHGVELGEQDLWE